LVGRLMVQRYGIVNSRRNPRVVFFALASLVAAPKIVAQLLVNAFFL
jgi:hypothetical protein